MNHAVFCAISLSCSFVVIWIIMLYFLADVYQKAGASQRSRLYPQHVVQCLALSHAQHMLVPSLSTRGKLIPCLVLVIPHVLSAYLSLSGTFSCSSAHTLFQSLLLPPSSTPSTHRQRGGKSKPDLREDNLNSSTDLI